MEKMTYDELKAKYNELNVDLKIMTEKYNKASDQAYERLNHLRAIGFVAALAVVGVGAYLLI